MELGNLESCPSTLVSQRKWLNIMASVADKNIPMVKTCQKITNRQKILKCIDCGKNGHDLLNKNEKILCRCQDKKHESNFWNLIWQKKCGSKCGVQKKKIKNEKKLTSYLVLSVENSSRVPETMWPCCSQNSHSSHLLRVVPVTFTLKKARGSDF